MALDLDAQHGINLHNVYIGPLCIVMAMGTAVASAMITSVFLNGSIIARDIIHAPIAGGIISGTACFFAVNPTQPIIAGFIGGVLQTLIQNFNEKENARTGSILSTISWSLFGAQGLAGGVVATIYMDIAQSSNTMNLSFRHVTLDKNPIHMLLMTLVSAGIGLGVGILAGLLVRLVSDDSRDYKLFSDTQHWTNDDGICFPGVVERQ